MRLQHRLTQARVVGLVQTAKVMGLQTVAKRVLGGDHSNWLTALGVDFVQSFEASPPVALDSLLGLQLPRADSRPTTENAGEAPASVKSQEKNSLTTARYRRPS